MLGPETRAGAEPRAPNGEGGADGSSPLYLTGWTRGALYSNVPGVYFALIGWAKECHVVRLFGREVYLPVGCIIILILKVDCVVWYCIAWLYCISFACYIFLAVSVMCIGCILSASRDKNASAKAKTVVGRRKREKGQDHKWNGKNLL